MQHTHTINNGIHLIEITGDLITTHSSQLMVIVKEKDFVELKPSIKHRPRPEC